MRDARHELFVHLVWSTWDRLPLLSGEVELAAHREVSRESAALGCHPLAVGGMEDHHHALLAIPPTVAVATVVKEIKGSSSHRSGHSAGCVLPLAGSYGAFSLRRSDVPTARHYILNQREHHRQGTMIADLEPLPFPIHRHP